MEAHVEPHPIADMIEGLFDAGGAGEEPFVIRDHARAVIEQAVDEFAKLGNVELMHIAHTMFCVADWLEDRRSPVAAAILCEVLDRPHVVGAMTMINERVRNELGSLEMGTPGDQFSSFAEKDTARRAPSIEDEAPDDAVKLGSLSYPKRL